MTPLHRIILVCLLAVWLPACASTQKEKLVVQRVEVPVYQPCKVRLAEPAALPVDAKPPATDIFEQMKAALASIDLLRADLKEARAAAEGCAGR